MNADSDRIDENAKVAESVPVPVAIQRPHKANAILWWLLPLASLCVCVGMFYYSQAQDGVRIEIEFRDGHGLKAQDVVKHKGIVVGEVERVELNENLDRVTAIVRLSPSSRRLAKEGSRFWIVRPSVSVDSIGGLDTILGAKYLGVAPGPLNAEPCYQFVGLDSVPIVAPKSGSLEITLDSPQRSGLLPNAPVLYRGYTIGRVLEIGLASDARSVRVRCAIDPEYRNLVRNDSKFWKQSGWQLSIGITGVKIDAETIPQLLTGSIQMATPGMESQAAESGASFELFEEAKGEWLEWAPGIAGAENGKTKWQSLPVAIQSVKAWDQRWFGIKTTKQESGWLLPMEDGAFLGLSNQLSMPAGALEGSFSISVGIEVLEDTNFQIRQLGGEHNGVHAVLVLPNQPIDIYSERWPMSRLSLVMDAKVPRNVIVSNPNSSSSVWIDAARLSLQENAWVVHKSVDLSSDMQGLPVVDTETNDVLGVLSFDTKSETAAVVLIDPTQISISK